MFNRKMIFPAACAGMLLFGISLITLGSVKPDLALRLGIDEITAGTLFSILPFGMLTGSFIFGPFADRFGFKSLMIISSLLLFVAFQGIAYSGNITALKLFVFVTGLAGGAINGAANALVSDISETGKGANLSIVGVFFGIGALGMPVILGTFGSSFSYQTIVSSVGFLTLAVMIFFLPLRFPPPKQTSGFPVSKIPALVRNNSLVIIAFFLLFQSSFEGIMNNWTTSYMTSYLGLDGNRALYGLSAFISGMTITRLLTGSLLRDLPEKNLLLVSQAIVFSGLLVLLLTNNFIAGLTGLFLAGSGLSSGFPVMLGITGRLFSELSGTAFSLVLSFALLGNMGFNYAMGYISKIFGIRHMLTTGFVQLAALFILSFFIFRITGRQGDKR
ncbi:MAG: MFS transporter [Bacteroidales bacterium]